MPSTRSEGDSGLRSVSFMIHTYLSLCICPIFIYTHTPTACARNGMRPHACACIEARLSRDVSHGGSPWYPSSTSNLFVCIGMSLCRLIHARRPCRERHVGCSAAPIHEASACVNVHILLAVSRISDRADAPHASRGCSRASVSIYLSIWFHLYDLILFHLFLRDTRRRNRDVSYY